MNGRFSQTVRRRRVPQRAQRAQDAGRPLPRALRRLPQMRVEAAAEAGRTKPPKKPKPPKPFFSWRAALVKEKTSVAHHFFRVSRMFGGGSVLDEFGIPCADVVEGREHCDRRTQPAHGDFLP